MNICILYVVYIWSLNHLNIYHCCAYLKCIVGKVFPCFSLSLSLSLPLSLSLSRCPSLIYTHTITRMSEYSNQLLPIFCALALSPRLRNIPGLVIVLASITFNWMVPTVAARCSTMETISDAFRAGCVQNSKIRYGKMCTTWSSNI